MIKQGAYGLVWLVAALPLAAQPLSTTTTPKNLSVTEYIGLYKDIAIREMERCGVPASIKLAQGIHESGAGNSTLAREANNHFGIKCGSGWTGETYYRWDDEAQESCFRKYLSGEESYLAHSDFLSKRKHYAFLFEYDKTDYKSWAHGLKKAGYATDPKYPDKIISTIEKYSLHLYDLERTVVITPKPDTASTTQPSTIVVESKRALRTKPRSFLFRSYKKGFFQQNGSTYAVAQKGESALALAERFGIPYLKFLKFNDLIDGDLLLEYQYAYIQPKKSIYKGEEMFHRIKNDETMYELSQFYGIRLADLLVMNGMVEGQEPLNGEIILLKEKAPFTPKLRPAGYIEQVPPAELDSALLYRPVVIVQPEVPRPDPQPMILDQPTYKDPIYRQDTVLNTSEKPIKPEEPYIPDGYWNEEPEVQDTVSTTILEPGSLFPPKTEPAKDTATQKPVPQPETPPIRQGGNPFDLNTTTTTDPIPVPDLPQPQTPMVTENWIEHIVQSNETLFSLSRRYQVSTNSIKEWNNLKTDGIFVGQKLRIQKK